MAVDFQGVIFSLLYNPWFIVVSLLVIASYFLLTRQPLCGGRRAGQVRRPIQEIIQETTRGGPGGYGQVKYDVKDLASPELVGFKLRLFVSLGFTYLGRHAILPRLMLRKSNFDLLKGEYLPERPTLYPRYPLPQVPNRRETNNRVLKDLLDTYTCIQDWRCNSLDYYISYKSRQCSPLDVTKKVLSAVNHSNKRDPPLRGVVEMIEEYSLNLAQSSTDRWSKGKPLSLLDGVPFTVKAEVVFESFSLTAGSTFKPTCSLGVSNETLIVRRLVDAGAIMIGLNNMQEFGTGLIGSNPHPGYLTPRNPYDSNRYCGGSSSGSAAAVSAGLCPISIGGDAGGSIRVPASLCGVVGLKPTYGLLDTSGFLPQTCSVGVPGPLCTSTIDVAISMSIMCPDGMDLCEFNEFKLNGLKIGIYKEFFEHADSPTVTLCREAIMTLSSLGAEIVNITIPELEEIRIAHALITSSEFCNSYTVDTDTQFNNMNPETLTLILAGSCFSSTEYINALKQRTRAINYLQYIFNTVDLIATPSAGCVAPLIPEGAHECGYGNAQLAGRLMRFSALGNLTGIPGISVPIGVSEEGLPVGLQLMSKGNNEGLLLRVSYALEKRVFASVPQPKSVYYNIIEETIKV